MRAVRAGLIGGVFALGVVVAPKNASASGISVARFGGEHGEPTTDNATAIFYNPAGIAISEDTHIFGDVNLAWRKVTYEHHVAATDDTSVNGANGGRASLFNVLASPFLGVTTKIGNLGLGAAFYVPYGGQSIWDKNDTFKDNKQFAGPYDGVQRWYVLGGIIRSEFLSLAAAYNIKPARLSIGLSGNLILSETDTIRAKTASGDTSLNDEGRAYLHTTGTDFSMGIGLLYEAVPKKFWIGASYQSRPNFSGMKSQKGHQATFLPRTSESNVNATLDTDLPDVVRAGVRYRPQPDIELRLFGDYQRWSHLKAHVVTNTDQNVPLLDQDRSWKDTFGVRLGFSKWLSKKFEAMTGMGYSSNAVPNSTQEPALPDWNGYDFTVGGRYEIVKKFFGSLSYTQFVFVPRDTTGDSVLTKTIGGAPPSPDSGGVYKQSVGLVNVNLDFAF